MDWIQFTLFAIATLGMFFWNRAESRNDMRHMEDQLKSNRDLILAVHNETKAEMKDFHGRLCTLEERYLQIITRKNG